MTHKRGFTLLDVFVALAFVGIAAITSSMVLTLAIGDASVPDNTVAVEASPEPPTIKDIEKVAKNAAEEHGIYSRVIALTENIPSGRLTIQIQGGLFDSSASAEVFLQSDNDLDAVRVNIDRKTVYEQIGGEIQIYLGMGDWEYLLDKVEHKVASDREERFRSEQEMRFGSLSGWGDDS